MGVLRRDDRLEEGIVVHMLRLGQRQAGGRARAWPAVLLCLTLAVASPQGLADELEDLEDDPFAD